jgi:hypothetical protein
MEGIFLEFENENSLRNYPFAAGCVPVGGDGTEIPSGLFVDACLYPINPSGNLFLSSVSKDGVVEVSDSSGAIMSGKVPSGGSRVVELYSLSGMARHMGTMVASSSEALSEFLMQGKDMEFGPGATTFAASCVFPVVIDGIASLDVGGVGDMSMLVSFANSMSDEVRVSKGMIDGHDTLRFDVVPKYDLPELSSIRQIRCVVDGRTPFRISKLSENTVLVYLEGIDKETVCASAHRENSYEMADTCDCTNSEETDPIVLPYKKQEVVVDIPYRADSAFYLVSSNMSGYGNPVSITLQDGVPIPKTSNLKVEPDNTNGGFIVPESEFIDDVSSKGIVIQVPGLSGGEV